MRDIRLTLVAILLAVVSSACAEDESPTGPTPLPCTYVMSVTQATIAADGGSGSVNLTTAASCVWTATSSAAWLTIQPTSATGPATVTFTAAPNTSEQSRTASVTIADQTLTVTQASAVPTPCTFDVSPLSAAFGFDGGQGTVRVATAAACAWSAAAAESWIAFIGETQRQGPGEITYAVQRNEETRVRTGSLTVAGRTVAVGQDAAPPVPPVPLPCDYSVAPVELVQHWHHTSANINLTTAAGCAWTVSAGADWLTIAPPSEGAGPRVIQFTNSIYTGQVSRRAPVQVRWPTPTAGQNVWITQEGCFYALAETSGEFSAAGGQAFVTVLGTPASVNCMIGCPWTAISQASWIHVTTPMPSAGDERFNYTVDANTTGQDRIGQIRVETGILMIRQRAN